jgi:hypothetical protein
MANRERKNELKIYLSDKEQYILEQIAKRMNATGNVYKADVEEVKKLMKQVWDKQKAMLSKQPTMKQ